MPAATTSAVDIAVSLRGLPFDQWMRAWDWRISVLIGCPIAACAPDQSAGLGAIRHRTLRGVGAS